MEIRLGELDWLPPDSILSVRAGGCRRQAPVGLVARQPLSFPALPDEDCTKIQVDLLQKIGCQSFDLERGRSNYFMPISVRGQQCALNFEVKVASSDQTQRPPPLEPAGEASSADDAAKARLREATAEANNYLIKSGFLDYMQELFQIVLQTKPADPFLFTWDRLREDKVMSETVRPSQEEAKPSPSPSEGPSPSEVAQEEAERRIEEEVLRRLAEEEEVRHRLAKEEIRRKAEKERAATRVQSVHRGRTVRRRRAANAQAPPLEQAVLVEPPEEAAVPPTPPVAEKEEEQECVFSPFSPLAVKYMNQLNENECRLQHLQGTDEQQLTQLWAQHRNNLAEIDTAQRRMLQPVPGQHLPLPEIVPELIQPAAPPATSLLKQRTEWEQLEWLRCRRAFVNMQEELGMAAAGSNGMAAIPEDRSQEFPVADDSGSRAVSPKAGGLSPAHTAASVPQLGRTGQQPGHDATMLGATRETYATPDFGDASMCSQTTRCPLSPTVGGVLDDTIGTFNTNNGSEATPINKLSERSSQDTTGGEITCSGADAPPSGQDEEAVMAQLAALIQRTRAHEVEAQQH